MPTIPLHPANPDADDAGIVQLQPRAHRVSSTALFGPSRELIIEHNRREYRLRLTQNGKLILTA